VYNKILIINPFGIGDVLFTTPILHALKDAIPEVKIGYLCNRRAREILESNPYIDKIFVYERDEFEAIKQESFFAWIKQLNSFLAEIKKENFDLALDLSLNAQYGFFSWFCGIKTRIGYDFKKRGRFLTHKVNLLGYNDQHIVQYYADLLKRLDMDVSCRSTELYLKKQDIAWTEEVLAKENIGHSGVLIGIVPGGGRSWGRDAGLKHWAAENFAQLADEIIANHKAEIIIMGDLSERQVAEKVTMNMRHKAIDFCGKTTLGQLAALLGKTELVITNDGGPLHMAVALGKKTISFFGPVEPRVYGPYPLEDKRHIVLRETLECSPCYRNFRLDACMRNRECLRLISVEEAFGAAEKLLAA
jgi:heptosyltransferase-2